MQGAAGREIGRCPAELTMSDSSSGQVFLCCFLALCWVCVSMCGSRGAKGVASVGGCWELLPCPSEPMPAGFKKDPQLVKGEWVVNVGKASVVTYFRRKNYCKEAIVSRERSENM